LADIERRAFRMAEIATGNREDALDVVQDAMIKLVEKYSDHGAENWAPLFYRILQRRILDWHRCTKVRRRVMGFFRGSSAEDDMASDVERYPDIEGRQPERQSQTDQLMQRLEPALRALPMRQQQAFLLRMWEGLDVRETAHAMGCSQGSVKTHYSRALKSLRNSLEGAPGGYDESQ